MSALSCPVLPCLPCVSRARCQNLNSPPTGQPAGKGAFVFHQTGQEHGRRAADCGRQLGLEEGSEELHVETLAANSTGGQD